MDLLQLLQAPESVCRPHSRFLFFIRLVTAFLMIFLSSLYLSLDQETTSSGAEVLLMFWLACGGFNLLQVTRIVAYHTYVFFWVLLFVAPATLLGRITPATVPINVCAMSLLIFWFPSISQGFQAVLHCLPIHASPGYQPVSSFISHSQLDEAETLERMVPTPEVLPDHRSPSSRIVAWVEAQGPNSGVLSTSPTAPADEGSGDGQSSTSPTSIAVPSESIVLSSTGKLYSDVPSGVRHSFFPGMPTESRNGLGQAPWAASGPDLEDVDRPASTDNTTGRILSLDRVDGSPCDHPP